LTQLVLSLEELLSLIFEVGQDRGDPFKNVHFILRQVRRRQSAVLMPRHVVVVIEDVLFASKKFWEIGGLVFGHLELVLKNYWTFDIVEVRHDLFDFIKSWIIFDGLGISAYQQLVQGQNKVVHSHKY